jgi:hypothetical protein
LTSGALSSAGEFGSVSVSVVPAGAFESSTKVIELAEQPELWPAGSVAMARTVVELLLAMFTVSPGEAKVAPVPVAAGDPLQSEVLYSWTVASASVVPLTSGLLSFDGESGSVSVKVTVGGVSSPFTRNRTTAKSSSNEEVPMSAYPATTALPSGSTRTARPQSASVGPVPTWTTALPSASKPVSRLPFEL